MIAQRHNLMTGRISWPSRRKNWPNPLAVLKKLQDRSVVAIRAADLSRAHRERLLKNGFLQEVMKGWYIAARPDDAAGESTAWYASFWAFCAAYLRERFGKRLVSFTRAFTVSAYRQPYGAAPARGAYSQRRQQGDGAALRDVGIRYSRRRTRGQGY